MKIYRNRQKYTFKIKDGSSDSCVKSEVWFWSPILGKCKAAWGPSLGNLFPHASPCCCSANLRCSRLKQFSSVEHFSQVLSERLPLRKKKKRVKLRKQALWTSNHSMLMRTSLRNQKTFAGVQMMETLSCDVFSRGALVGCYHSQAQSNLNNMDEKRSQYSILQYASVAESCNAILFFPLFKDDYKSFFSQSVITEGFVRLSARLMWVSKEYFSSPLKFTAIKRKCSLLLLFCCF